MADSFATATNRALDAAYFPRQDFFYLAGNKSPGRATLVGAGTPRRWKKNSGYATSGASLVYQGNDLSEFSFEVYMWDRKLHVPQWNEFAKNVLAKPPPGVTADAYLIEHPALVFPPLNITAAVILDVSQPEQDDTGGWTVTIKFQEYAPPKTHEAKAVATPDVPNAPPKPADAAEQQIAQLSSQLNGLSSGNDKSGLF
jgi:hypothetical protein